MTCFGPKNAVPGLIELPLFFETCIEVAQLSLPVNRAEESLSPPPTLFSNPVIQSSLDAGPLERRAAFFKELVPQESGKDALDPKRMTQNLIREIFTYRDKVDAPRRLQAWSEVPSLLITLGQGEEAAQILEAMAQVYQEVGSKDAAQFHRAQALFLRGDLSASLENLRSISASSRLAEAAELLSTQVSQLQQKQRHLQTVMPHLIALGQIRMRVNEQLEFSKSQVRSTWLKSERGVEADHAEYDHLIRQANGGLDALEQALISGRVNSLEAAFALAESLPGFLGSGSRQSAEAFRYNLLENSGAEVAELIKFSKISDNAEREAWLLAYTQNLRKNFGSLDGYPAQTIFANLQSLLEAQSPQIQGEARATLQEFLGERGITGLNDAEYAGLLREGTKNTVPLVLASMVAGPFGAYAEGSVAGLDLALAGKTLWSGVNAAGQAGLLANGLGFATEASIFFLAHDSLHASLIGGGEYFTREGLARSFLMLGGLKVLKATWRAATASYFARWAENSTHSLLPPLANQAGEFLTEWAGFVGIGKVESILHLVPPQDTTLQKEVAQAGILLLQLRLGGFAGETLTRGFVSAQTLRIKLDNVERLFRKALEQGRITEQAFQEALGQIAGWQYALAQSPNLSSHVMLSEKYDGRSSQGRMNGEVRLPQGARSISDVRFRPAEFQEAMTLALNHPGNTVRFYFTGRGDFDITYQAKTDTYVFRQYTPARELNAEIRFKGRETFLLGDKAFVIENGQLRERTGAGGEDPPTQKIIPEKFPEKDITELDLVVPVQDESTEVATPLDPAEIGKIEAEPVDLGELFAIHLDALEEWFSQEPIEVMRSLNELSSDLAELGPREDLQPYWDRLLHFLEAASLHENPEVRAQAAQVVSEFLLNLSKISPTSTRGLDWQEELRRDAETVLQDFQRAELPPSESKEGTAAKAEESSILFRGTLKEDAFAEPPKQEDTTILAPSRLPNILSEEEASPPIRRLSSLDLESMADEVTPRKAWDITEVPSTPNTVLSRIRKSLGDFWRSIWEKDEEPK